MVSHVAFLHWIPCLAPSCFLLSGNQQLAEKLSSLGDPSSNMQASTQTYFHRSRRGDINKCGRSALCSFKSGLPASPSSDKKSGNVWKPEALKCGGVIHTVGNDMCKEESTSSQCCCDNLCLCQAGYYVGYSINISVTSLIFHEQWCSKYTKPYTPPHQIMLFINFGV